MKTKIYLLMLALSFCSFSLSSAFAQIDTVDLDVDDEFDFKLDLDKTEFEDFNLFRFLSGNDQPFMSVSFGITQPKIDKDAFTGNFSNNNFLEGKIGYSETMLHTNGKILKMEDDFLGFKYSSEDLFTDEKENEKIGSKRWVITWGDSKGYGWALSNNADLVLYSSDIFNWTRIDFNTENITDTTALPAIKVKTDNIADDLRFGRSFEAGIRLRFFDNISLIAGYEQEQIFPRFKIWKWAGSEIIEAAISGLASDFISKVIKRSSVGGPIVNFIIKNGISYAFYELRRKDMNWPFKTEAPLVFDNFKIGVSFTF